MKIGLAQLNYKLADFKANTGKIIDAIEKAKQEGVDLLVFSELSVSGYPPLDFLERREFVDACMKGIEEIAGHCKGVAAIVGGPVVNTSPGGKNLFNAVFFMEDGEIKQEFHKTLLPTYDIFDEYRYFEPNREFHLLEFGGKKIAVTICEDLWDSQEFGSDFSKDQLYGVSPMEELAKKGAELILNIAASPYSYHKEVEKQRIFTSKAEEYRLPVFFVNQVGAQTELIFEGGSTVVSPNARIFDRLDLFGEDIRYYELDEVIEGPAEKAGEETGELTVIGNIHDALVMGVRDYFSKMGFKKAILGLSGGIDSAVVLVIAQRALGAKNVKAILMPSEYSSEHSVTDSLDLVATLGVEHEIISIEKSMNSFSDMLAASFKDLPEDITEENIQARIRAIILMAFSNKFGHILLNTSNKSEAAVGYGTLYGDMSGGLSVMGDVYKTDVYRLAKYMNRETVVIPWNIITKPPSAELRPDQKDSDSLPDYDLLDQVLFRYIEMQRGSESIVAEGFDREVVSHAIRLVNANEYKRFQSPPVLRLSSKAFGPGRRHPLVASYDFL